MSDIATCAVCGEKRELCRSVRVNGIQQPRMCKDCLIKWGADAEINVLYWIMQISELDDTETIKALAEMDGREPQ